MWRSRLTITSATSSGAIFQSAPFASSPLENDVATDPGYFTFLSSCTPDAKIVLGDARLTLADASDGAYDLIIVDAFSSDAIPIHLLTQEAMAIYLGGYLGCPGAACGFTNVNEGSLL